MKYYQGQSVRRHRMSTLLWAGRPVYRVDGQLDPIEGEALSPEMMEKLLMPLIDVRHRAQLQENGQTDFAYAISGVGRFRVNVFKQRERWQRHAVPAFWHPGTGITGDPFRKWWK